MTPTNTWPSKFRESVENINIIVDLHDIKLQDTHIDIQANSISNQTFDDKSVKSSKSAKSDKSSKSSKPAKSKDGAEDEEDEAKDGAEDEEDEAKDEAEGGAEVGAEDEEDEAKDEAEVGAEGEEHEEAKDVAEDEAKDGAEGAEHEDEVGAKDEAEVGAQDEEHEEAKDGAQDEEHEEAKDGAQDEEHEDDGEAKDGAQDEEHEDDGEAKDGAQDEADEAKDGAQDEEHEDDGEAKDGAQDEADEAEGAKDEVMEEENDTDDDEPVKKDVKSQKTRKTSVVDAERVNKKSKLQDNDEMEEDETGTEKHQQDGYPVTSYVEDLTVEINITDIIYDDKSKLTYETVIDTIVRFNKTTRGLYAIKQAATSAIDYTIKNAKSNPRYPIVFTSASLDDNILSFYTVFFGYGANGTQRANAMKNGKICTTPVKFKYMDQLDVYPHQLYAFFICCGIYVEHVKTVKLPRYLGKDWAEEKNKDTKYSNDETWNIKSIRNMVFHDPPPISPDREPPTIMLLIDWEMKNNKGEWIESPNKKSCLTWEPFYSLKDYYVLSQYLYFRADGIEGVPKDYSVFHYNKIEPDYMSYLRRHGKLRKK